LLLFLFASPTLLGDTPLLRGYAITLCALFGLLQNKRW
jgi:hypothetical protein